MGTGPADCSCGGGASSSTIVPLLPFDGVTGTEGASGRGSGSVASSGFCSAGLASGGVRTAGGAEAGNKNNFPVTNKTNK